MHLLIINRNSNNGSLLLISLLIIISSTLCAQKSAPGFGELVAQGPKFSGQKYGKWTLRGSNNKIYQIQYYKNNKADSTWLTFFPNGKLRNKTKYQKGRAIKWISLIEDSLRFELVAKDSIPEKLLSTFQNKENYHHFKLMLKTEIIDDVDKRDYYLKDSFYDSPLWNDLTEFDMVDCIKGKDGAMIFKSWDSHRNITMIAEFENKAELSKQEYIYNKKGLTQKKYYRCGELIRIEKYKNGVVKVIDK